MTTTPPRHGRSGLRQTGWALRTVMADTVREAVRGRWLWMCGAGTLCVAGIATFARALALTDEHALALSFAAPVARLLAVLIIALSAIVSVSREQSDRTLLLALSAPMSRTLWVAGKALGLFALAAVTAGVLALPVLAFGPPPAAFAAWTMTLALELAVIAAVSLAVAIVLVQVPPAVCAVVAFYVLARDLNVMRSLGQRAQDFSEPGAASVVVQAIALLFPRLDLFARSDWLLGMPPSGFDLAVVVAQAAVYVLLALTVATLDLRRAQFA
jgi:ABC-type Na+ efflux pump permease subunit